MKDEEEENRIQEDNEYRRGSEQLSTDFYENNRDSVIGPKDESTIYKIPPGLRVGSNVKTWTDISKINYLSSPFLDSHNPSALTRRSMMGGLNAISEEYTVHNYMSKVLKINNISETFPEQFPVNVTSMMNEDQHWGCFYILPELYSDVYSPMVRVRDDNDVPKIENGVLTKKMVAVYLTYLKRTPILGDYVCIKLDLSTKYLVNIDVLEDYRYLVWLDLSTNYLTQLKVLSHLRYLQFLNVNFNRLDTVLQYKTPQWFLTEVHYKFNCIKKMNDLTAFWSLAILDLSHNNIKSISGLENLRFLRRLDLSFNHIQRLENLNYLRLLWLDVSYNNISSFELGPQGGLWTLYDLEYLNLNENSLTSLRIFSGCIRLRELYIRNNRIGTLLELAVHMRQMKRLMVLDLRANPICSTPSYKRVTFNTFPKLFNLDAEEVDHIEQRSAKMEMCPDVMTVATRGLLRLLYIEQLSKAKVSPFIPPADTTDVPLVILVGYEAVGKGALARRLAEECKDTIELALQHTTANYHSDHYRYVYRTKFDDMLINGEFLTYSEINSESYGLSREEAFVKDGKVKIACMDLLGALMLRLRGYRPFLILANHTDQVVLNKRQAERYAFRNREVDQRFHHSPLEKSTLQVMLSGTILIKGILNEILIEHIPDEVETSQFQVPSNCSLLMDSGTKKHKSAINEEYIDRMMMSDSSFQASSRPNQEDTSLHSIYKESQGTSSYSGADAQGSYHESFTKKSAELKLSEKDKSVDFSKYASTTWKVADSTKSSKSVTFTSQDTAKLPLSSYGLMVEEPTPMPPPDKEKEDKAKYKDLCSISKRLPAYVRTRTASGISVEDTDLWIAFLVETGLFQVSDLVYELSESRIPETPPISYSDPQGNIKQLDKNHKISAETQTSNIRDDYETIHRNQPGLFWDVVTMDNPDEAFQKMKRIIKDIVNAQKKLRPMFDIDFANMDIPIVQKRLVSIRNQIAPNRLFY